MPLPSQNPDHATGFGAMAQVLEGYMVGEEIKRNRFIEERDYAFQREQFEESTRRFDVSFEEGVRQFDQTLAFQAEQSALMREQQRFLQDDQQLFLAEESELQRAWQTEETQKERTSREEHQKAERAKDYYRIQKNVEMQNADRAQRAEGNELALMKRYLGDSSDYNSMPDELFQGRSGKTYTPEEINLSIELQRIVDGKGSDVLNVSPENAATYLDTIEAARSNQGETGARQTEGALYQSMVSQGQFVGVIPNVDKEAGLEHLISRRVGGVEAMQDLTPEEFEKHKRAVIHDLNSLEMAENRYQQRNLEYQQELLEMEVGVSNQGGYAGGVGGKRAQSPFAALAAANGQYFVWNNDTGFPVWSGRGSSAVGAEATEMAFYTADYLGLAENNPTWDEDRIAEEQQKIITSMETSKRRMAAAISEHGGDPRQADKYFNTMKSVALGESIDPSEYMVRSDKPLRGGAAPLGTADGATGAGVGPEPSIIETPYGTFGKGDPGYAQAVKYQQQQQATQKSEETMRVAQDQYRDQQALIKGLEEEQIRANAATNISQFIATEPPADVLKEFEAIVERNPAIDYETAASTAYHRVGKAGFNIGPILAVRPVSED